MMRHNEQYTYNGKDTNDVKHGDIVRYVTDAVKPGWVNVSVVSTGVHVTVASADLLAVEVVVQDDMAEAESMAAMLTGLQDAMENTRPVAISFVDATGNVNTAMYAKEDYDRLVLVNGTLLSTFQLMQHLATVPYVKGAATIASSAVLVAGHLVGKTLDRWDAAVAPAEPAASSITH